MTEKEIGISSGYRYFYYTPSLHSFNRVTFNVEILIVINQVNSVSSSAGIYFMINPLAIQQIRKKTKILIKFMSLFIQPKEITAVPGLV
jgi:hypothetical protein